MISVLPDTFLLRTNTAINFAVCRCCVSVSANWGWSLFQFVPFLPWRNWNKLEQVACAHAQFFCVAQRRKYVIKLYFASISVAVFIAIFFYAFPIYE